MRTTMIVLALGLLTGAGCYKPGEGTRGLPCERDSHCDGLDCIQGICGGPQSSVSDTNETANETTNPNTDPTDDQCLDLGQDCASGTCCDGLVCFDFETEVACTAACAIGSDCASCCCFPNGSEGACRADFCSGACEPGCSAIPSLCGSNGDCCEYLSGGSYCVDFPDLGGVCAASCTVDSDCAGNCCILLESGASACGPTSLCEGGAVPGPGEWIGSDVQRAPGAAPPPARSPAAPSVIESWSGTAMAPREPVGAPP